MKRKLHSGWSIKEIHLCGWEKEYVPAAGDLPQAHSYSGRSMRRVCFCFLVYPSVVTIGQKFLLS